MCDGLRTMTIPLSTCRKLLHLFGAAAKILSVASLDLDYVSVVGDIWSLPRCMDRRWFRPPADHFGDLTTKVHALKSKTPDDTIAPGQEKDRGTVFCLTRLFLCDKFPSA